MVPFFVLAIDTLLIVLNVKAYYTYFAFSLPEKSNKVDDMTNQ